METGETIEKVENSEKNEAIEENAEPKPTRYIKEHNFLTQTEALLSSNSKTELQDLFHKYDRHTCK